MPLVDMALPQLIEYRPPATREPDFDAFWSRTFDEAQDVPLDCVFEPVPDYPVSDVRVAKVFYTGWAGARLCAWWLVPPDWVPGHREGKRPCMVFYHGYSGHKGPADVYLGWVLQGYCVLAVDTRGQSGESTDPKVYPGGHYTGWMTQGILDPHEYYYRGVYVDCVRALDVAESQPEIDASRIGLAGASQGGALTLAVAALDPRQRARLAIPDVPYLCHFRRAVDIAAQPPYTEIAAYCRHWPAREAQVFQTLTYVDNMNLAPRITCPVLMSVSLQDVICPPSTVYAAFNHLGSSTKEMKVFPYNGHEGNPNHTLDKYRWARRYVRGD